jgi:Fe-S oxidoreductase
MDTVTPYLEIIELIKAAGGDACKLCYQCGKCDVVCPWNRVRDFSIRRIVREASLGLSEIEVDDIWRCTTCGTCPSHCPRGVKQIEVGVSVRRLAAEYGVFPTMAKAARTAAGSLSAEGNPLNEDRGTRADWAEGLSIQPFDESMEVLYFVGCYYAYDPRLRKAAVALAEVLKKAGVSFGILGDEESCCGESIRKTGDEEVFKALAKRNIKTFIDRGVKKILVASPHCYETFRNEYSEFMVHFEVVHTSEFLAGLVREGRLAIQGEYARKVTYHDPCYLGRHNNIYDEPRELLTAIPGVELTEMPDHHQASLCCGGGGGGIWMETPKEERLSNLRLEQAKQTGAEVLVTACPYCISNFEESRLTLGYDEDLEVRDLAEIMVQVVEEPS